MLCLTQERFEVKGRRELWTSVSVQCTDCGTETPSVPTTTGDDWGYRMKALQLRDTHGMTQVLRGNLLVDVCAGCAV